MDGRANPVMDRKVVELMYFFLGVAAIVAEGTSPQLLDLAGCNAAVIVVVV